MKLENDIKLDFGDVLIRPKRSTLGSRSEVNPLRTIKFANSRASWTGVPIMASNMDTTGTFEMYRELSEHKMLTCFHKHYKPTDYPKDLDKDFYIVSTGILDPDWIKLQEIVRLIEPKFVCIDVANGYSVKLINFIRKVREKYPEMTLFGGNVVTREMVEELTLNGGLDVCKIGIGNGSVCTTRLQTGVGYPQLSAIMECSDAAHGISSHILSDGGVQNPGDISKAFGAGADFIMSGSLFSGHDESGGELVEEDGKKYKLFYGMSSSTAMNKYHGGVASYRSAEGKTVKIPYRGPVENTVQSILGGIRSTMTYIGARQLKDLPKCTTFIQVNRQVNTMYNGSIFSV